MANRYLNVPGWRESKAKAEALLREHGKVWSDGRYRYYSGWDDARVSKESGANDGYVAKLRVQLFGPQRISKKMLGPANWATPPVSMQKVQDLPESVTPQSELDRLWMEGQTKLDNAKAALDKLMEAWIGVAERVSKGAHT